MAIDFKSKFDELFGGEEGIVTAPTLRDVAPGLVEGSGAKFQSKELNPRRTAVSARGFRNPRVRSREGAFEGVGPEQTSVPRVGSTDRSFQTGGRIRAQDTGKGEITRVGAQ